MAWGTSTGTVAGANSKVAGASFTTGAISCPIGDQIFLLISYDNLTATTPTTSSITVPGGESATWQKLATGDSASGTAAAGARTELWAIQPTQTWTAFSPVVNLSASVTAKASSGFCRSGGQITRQRAATVPLVLTQTSGAAPSVADTGPINGDLVIGMQGRQQAPIGSSDTDTTNGSWSALIENGTTGGTANTNISALLQHKVVTADGTQTFNLASQTSTGQIGIVVLPPASAPTTIQASRVHAEALVQGVPAVQASRVHAEALFQHIGIDTYDQKVLDLHAIGTYLCHEASGVLTSTPPSAEITDVTPSGSYTYGVTPKVGLSGTAIQGSNGATSVIGVTWPTGTKTITFWVKKASGGSAILPLIGNTGGTSTNRAWVAVSSGDILVQSNGPIATTLSGAATSSGLLDGTWRHFGLKADGTNWTVYVDGVNLGTLATAASIGQLTRLMGAWSSQQTPGGIHRISFFRDALSDADMLALATSVQTKPAINRVSETDTARTLLPLFTPPINRASETDTARALTSTQKQTLGRATETDTARTLLPIFIPPIGRVSETDTARALTAKQSQVIGRASETDTARSLTPLFAPAIGRATETDTARPLSTIYMPAIGRATETDTAITIGALSPSGVPILRAEETDTARALLPVFIPPINRASETDTARALARLYMPAIGRASETDTARALTPVLRPTINRVTETDTARSLTTSRKPAIGRATETDTAFAVTSFSGPIHAQLTWYDGTENTADITWYDGAVEDEVTVGWWGGTTESPAGP